MENEYKNSNAAVPASWARQFARQGQQSTPQPQSRPIPSAASTPTKTEATRPSTVSAWAKQFGPVAVPVAERPSSESVWAKQFNKSATAAPASSSPGNTVTQAQIDAAIRGAQEAATKSRAARGSVSAGARGMSSLGFKISNMRASAALPYPEIRKLIAGGVLDHIAAKEAIEVLGDDDPEVVKLVNELFDAMGALAASR